MMEEQGWVVRMVHMFRTESLNVQSEVRGSSSPFPFSIVLPTEL